MSSTRGRRWSGVDDGSVTLGGHQVRLLSAPARPGSDEPQLLVHGLGASATTWVEVIDGLRVHGPVAAVDLPGFGRTPAAAADGAGVRPLVRSVIDVADALGWERFTLHGNSMGGLIGTLLAAENPERVSGLVLVSPALPPASPLHLLAPSRAGLCGLAPVVTSAMTAGALGALGLAGPGLDERRNRALLGLIYPDPDAVDPELLELMAADFPIDDPDLVAQQRRATMACLLSIATMWTDPRQALRAVDRVQAPTLLLGGTADALVPARVLRQLLRRRPDWDGTVLDDRRHALMMEAPAEYLDLVATWTRRRSAAA